MPIPKEVWFEHAKPEVSQDAIAFIAWLSVRLEDLVRPGDVRDQLDRASASITLNKRLQRIVRMLMGLIKKDSARDYGKGKPMPTSAGAKSRGGGPK